MAEGVKEINQDAEAKSVRIIPREEFLELVRQGKVIEVSRSRSGVVHEVLRYLEREAATADAIADALKVPRRTVLNAINHLRHRYNKRITRFYNPNDRKYYYCLEE